MMNSFKRTTWIPLFSFFITSALVAQDSDLQVNRCGAVSRSAPVRNISVDADNHKWIASGAGVYQVRACDLSNRLELETGEMSALMFPGGNADARWTGDILQMTLGKAPEITAAYYDSRNDWLWLGTREDGLFQLKTKPAPQLINTFTDRNSKLKSNHITTILQDRTGQYWVGTENGMIIGTPDRWKPDLEGYTVQRVREFGTEVYILADGELWIVSNGRWDALVIKEKALEGEVEDFDLDRNGNLWLLSRIVSFYDMATDDIRTFSGPEYYTSMYGRCIAVDQDGAIWIGTDDKGLYLIDKATSLVVNCMVDKEISCDGNGQDGELLVKINGGKPPFTYAWSDPALQGDNPRNIAAGNYTVTITDSSGKTKSAKTTIDDPRISLTMEEKKAESAPGKNDGSAEVRVSGGTPAYTYRWDNGETDKRAVNLAGGAHSITVTDQKGCSATATVTVQQRLAALTATIEETTPIPCAGGNTILRVEVTGGKEPYQYEWSNPRLDGTGPSGVSAGTYTLTVIDAAGGKTVTSISVVQPSALSAVATAQASASTGNSDGRAGASPRGGTSPYSYSWDNGETTETASQLAPGSHTVTITDANGCTITAKVEIGEDILPLTAQIEETGQVQCHDGESSLQVTVNGGKNPFEFRWSVPELVGYQPGGLKAGTYTVTVSDAAGNETSAAFTIKQPDPLAATAVLEGAASTGGSDGKALVKITGGTSPYQYRWDNSETTDRATRLTPGTHAVTVSDVYGCSTSTTIEVTEDILPLAALIEETRRIECNGGTADLRVNITGGKGPFQFQWSVPALQGEQPVDVPAGVYQLVVTDAAGGRTATAFKVQEPDPVTAVATVDAPATAGQNNGRASMKVTGGVIPYLFRWDNEETGDKATRLSPGEHRYTVTDDKGCTATGVIQVDENILPLTTKIEEVAPINCNGGATGLRVTVNGGKGPYQYYWNNAAAQGAQPAGLVAGNYQLTIIDATGTESAASILVKEPDPITLSVTVQEQASTGANDGKALVAARGGTPPYSYNWDSGETETRATQLGPGDHMVTVTDAKGCIATGKAAITENILPLEVDVVETGDIKCTGETSGLKVTVKGGKPPYQYKWDNPAWSGAQINNVSAATYAVLVTDAMGTTQSAVAIVNAPDPLKAEVTRVVGATTERTEDGKTTLNISGGTEPVAIKWDNGEATKTASKLTLGIHGVTVTDANGCSVTQTVEIKKRILPELNASLLRSGQKIRMEQLQFKADSSSLTLEAYPTLDELFDFMMENGNVVIEVGGHTNSTPSDEFCDRLSTARAKTVADYLIEKGIDPQRVAYKGYGKRQPVATNATREGRKLNQRVEIKIVALQRE
ncbi:MAG: hypothetical protein EP344_10485 [Bacteroidetes bacterium]|nr:MAG: hypothetical protein EP344_10485 [Bacteroidota bacterium]